MKKTSGILGICLIIGLVSAFFMNNKKTSASNPVIISIEAGNGISLMIDETGSYWQWGKTRQEAYGDDYHWIIPNKVDYVKDVKQVKEMYILKEDGTLKGSYDGYVQKLIDTGLIFPNENDLKMDVTAEEVDRIVEGIEHRFIIKKNGEVWGFGTNSDGELGVNRAVSQDGVVKSMIEDVKDVAAGYYHSVAVKKDGTVWAWGTNKQGQLGNGTTKGQTDNGFYGIKYEQTYYDHPILVEGLSDIKEVEAAHYFSVALKEDGTVWTWGENRMGQLGVGDFIDRTTPTKVEGITDVISISATHTHVLALKSDGTVWSWGANGFGQVGNGKIENQNTPQKIEGLSKIKMVDTGYGHSLAVTEDNVLYAWGNNRNGQIGDGTLTNQLKPVEIKFNPRLEKITNIQTVSYTENMSLSWDEIEGAIEYVVVRNGKTVYRNEFASFIDSGLTPDTTYTYTLYGINESGEGIENTIKVKTKEEMLAAPAYFHAAIKDKEVELEWGEVNGADEYEVIRNETLLYSGTETSYIDQKVELDTFYHYEVVAKNKTSKSDRITKRVYLSKNSEHGKEMALGSQVTYALDYEGKLWAWGGGTGGAINGLTNDSTKPNLAINENGEYLIGEKVAAGAYHGLVVDENEETWLVGSHGEKVGKITFVEGLSQVLTVEAASKRSAAVTRDGSVYVWGQNPFLRIDEIYKRYENPTVVEGITNVVDVSLGKDHMLFLKKDGTVWGMGHNERGQIGDGTFTRPNEIKEIENPIQVKGVRNAIQIEAGERVSAVLKADGTVWMFGENHLSLGNNVDPAGRFYASFSERPVKVKHVTDIVSISMSKQTVFALKKDGTVWAWGTNKANLISQKRGPVTFPVQISHLTDVMAIKAGLDHVSIIKKDGTSWFWGNNYHGQLGDGTFVPKETPVEVVLKSEKKEEKPLIVREKTVNHTTISLEWEDERGDRFYEIKRNGTIIETFESKHFTHYGLEPSTLYHYEITPIKGKEKGEPIGIEIKTNPMPHYPFDIVDISGGNSHSAAVTSDGKLYAWGANWSGQAGNSNFESVKVPETVYEGENAFVKVASGEEHSLALTKDGKVWGWGSNWGKQLQATETEEYPDIVEIPTIESVIDISAGWRSSYALKEDGTVWAWGVNGSGELGDGTTTDRLVPVQVMEDEDTPLSNIIQVESSKGYQSVLALKSDGSVWGWGYNSEGQVGNNENETQAYATQLTGLSGIKDISIGDKFGVALKEDGTVLTWGHNYYGTLGDGTETSRKTPQTVPNLNGVVDVSAGDYHVVALKSDGTIWSWGMNWYGALGSGDYENHTAPVQVLYLKDVTSVHTGSYSSYAIRSDGMLWAFGENDSYYTVGDGVIEENKPVPVQPSFVPTAPRGVTVKEEGENVIIRWQKNGEPDIVGYHVYIDNKKVNEELILYDEYTSQIETGEIHKYEVIAVDQEGFESQKSYAVYTEFEKLQEEVNGLSAIYKNQHVQFTWENPFHRSFKHVNVYRNGEFLVKLEPVLYSKFEDFEDEEWVFDFDGDWIRNEHEYAGEEGGYSYSNRNITHNEMSETSVQIEIPKGANRSSLSFHYMTSSERGYDPLVVKIDKEKVLEQSSFEAWQKYQHIELTPGNHTIMFQYKKDDSKSLFNDTVYIDHLKFTYQYIGSYRDTSVLPNKTYSYTFKTVDLLGNESDGVDVTVETN